MCSASWSDWVDDAKKMASILNAPIEDFVNLYFGQSESFITGVFPSYEAYIKHICDQLGVIADDHQVESAANIPVNLTKQMLKAHRNDALDVLEQLKANNYKIGLISDCGPDMPDMWNETPFANLIDITIFSCSVGINKADIGIFQLATAELAVKPEHCIYIADGNRKELANAEKLGMKAIQILIPEEIDDSPLREEWNGLTISSLMEVFEILRYL